MATDYRLCPINEKADPGESTIPADPQLLADGWVRRNVTDPTRVQGRTELYDMLGFAVLAQKLTSADFGTAYASCTEAVCGVCVMICPRHGKTGDRQRTHE